MKKANGNFMVMNTIDKLDFTHEGFALDHEKKVLLVLEQTDRAIKNGNVTLLLKFIDVIAAAATPTTRAIRIFQA